MSRAARRPDPAPLETDDVRPVAVGTAAWVVALVVLVVLKLTGGTRVEGWWIVMCLWGTALGAFGVGYCLRRRSAAERDRARGVPPRP